MILTPEKTIEAHRQSGIWGNVTLDALFRKTAAASPRWSPAPAPSLLAIFPEHPPPLNRRVIATVEGQRHEGKG